MIGPATLINPEEPLLSAVPSAQELGVPRHVTKHLLKGSFALGFAVSLERGMGFLANILAARLGGAATFGAYSLAINTANNISTYAGGGIGSTAARFSGKYQRGGPGYSTLAKVLFIVSVCSALTAAAALWLGAAPLAHLMQKTSLTGLLRWTAVSAVGIILLECARGFFVGQSRLPALVLLSLIVGVGMVLILPFAAIAHSPVRMIVLQGTITMSAVGICLLLASPLGLFSPSISVPALPVLPMLKEIWMFGLVQLVGLVGVNFAGWWLMTLLARSDKTLVQVSFFAIASQMRNIVSLAPSMLTESSYAVMADPEGGASSTPQHVMALCTYAATVGVFIPAAVGIIMVPWALKFVYGHGYQSAAAAVILALAVAVVHMGNAPASARLSIVSIRSLGIINTLWAIFVATGATFILLHSGSAWKAMSIYFAAHLLSSVLVLLVLHRRDFIPTGITTVFYIAAATGGVLAALAGLRILRPAAALPLTLAMLLLFVAVVAVLLHMGRTHHWLPRAAALQSLMQAIRTTLRQLIPSLRPGGSSNA